MAQQLTPAKACDWLAALDQRQAHLDERLRDALASSSPDPERISRIKSEKMHVEDTIASLALYLLDGRPLPSKSSLCRSRSGDRRPGRMPSKDVQHPSDFSDTVG